MHRELLIIIIIIHNNLLVFSHMKCSLGLKDGI